MHILNEAMGSLAQKKKVKTQMKDNLEEESGFHVQEGGCQKRPK